MCFSGLLDLILTLHIIQFIEDKDGVSSISCFVLGNNFRICLGNL